MEPSGVVAVVHTVWTTMMWLRHSAD